MVKTAPAETTKIELRQREKNKTLKNVDSDIYEFTKMLTSKLPINLQKKPYSKRKFHLV